MREDGPHNNIRWLTDSIGRLLQREMMLNARALQTNRIQFIERVTTATLAALAPDKGKWKKATTRGKGNNKGTYF